MKLAEALLPRLAEWQPLHPGRQTFTTAVASEAGGAGWQADITVDRRDELSCLVWELGLVASGPLVDAAPLKSRAGDVARRIAGLPERLAVIEVDEVRREAMLRSDTPTVRAGLRSWFELMLAGDGKATVRRFQSNTLPGSRTERVPFALTHEVIASVLEQLAETAQAENPAS